MILQDVQNAVGNSIIIKSATQNGVEWQFADKNANKAYGKRTYRPVNNQSSESVAEEISNQASRM